MLNKISRGGFLIFFLKFFWAGPLGKKNIFKNLLRSYSKKESIMVKNIIIDTKIMSGKSCRVHLCWLIWFDLLPSLLALSVRFIGQELAQRSLRLSDVS